MPDPVPAPVNTGPVLPFSTGSAGMDSLIRSGIISLSSAVAGVCVLWLGKHGYNDPSIGLLVGGAVFGVVAAAAGALWGWYAQHWAKVAVIQHVITAAETGVVPPAIAAEAQKIESKALGKI